MNIALWVVQVLLALVFLMAGSMKALKPKAELAEKMEWVNDYSDNTVKLIGVLEILGAIGVVLPAATGILPWLTPLAAVGLVLTMIGAAITHARMGDFPGMGPSIVFLVLSLFVAYGRF